METKIRQEQLETINNYKYSFIEDYSDWKYVVETINNNLYDYLDLLSEDDDNIDTTILKPFSYDDFCHNYILQIERYYEEFDKLNKEAINSIFEVMIILKISESSLYPKELIEKFIY